MNLHSPAALADLFGDGVTPRQILDWRREHGWPCVRVGRTVRFTDEQVEHILAKHTVTGEKAIEADDLIEGQTPRSKRSAA